MNNQPINREALDNKDKPAIKEPFWKAGGEFHEISEMDDEFLRKALLYAYKQIGYHANKISQHENSLNVFLMKAEQLTEEAHSRDAEWIADRIHEVVEV